MFSLDELLTPGAPSPFAFLLELHASRTPSLLLVTGASGVGKTTWCQELGAFACAQNWAVSGLVSPAVVEDGRKVAIDLQELGSVERRRLATRRSTTERAGIPEDRELKNAVTTGDWWFEPKVLCWGNDILEDLRTKISNLKWMCPDLLIIDELGPLEFRQQLGLQAGMKLVDSWSCNLICVTVRPSLVGAARMRWPWAHVYQIGSPD